ncbi:MAG TPA: hypothetical protein VKP13_06440 [Nitrospira sp.]|nr:hypothetical protein [Nitrospira sp.]
MTSEEQIVKMTTAIRQAIKVMGDRFGSTDKDVERAIQELKASIQAPAERNLSVETLSRPDSQLLQNKEVTVGT